MFIIIAIVVLILIFWMTSDDEPNTLVVEIETGRVVKFIYINWDGPTSSRMEGIISAQIDFPDDKYELVEQKDALNRFDVHVYTRK